MTSDLKQIFNGRNKKPRQDEIIVFHQAANSGKLDVLKAYIKKFGKKYIDAEVEGYAAHALSGAVRFDKYEAAAYLIAQGADVSKRLPGDRLCVHNARSVAMFELLKKNNADLHAVCNSGENALFFNLDRPDVTKWLLDEKLNPHLVNISGWNLLLSATDAARQAAPEKSAAVIALVLATKPDLEFSIDFNPWSNVDSIGCRGYTAVIVAAAIGASAVLRGLLDAGADYTAKNENGLSAEDFARDQKLIFCVNSSGMTEDSPWRIKGHDECLEMLRGEAALRVRKKRDYEHMIKAGSNTLGEKVEDQGQIRTERRRKVSL